MLHESIAHFQAFANPEDAKLHPKGVVTLNDSDVERYRRAHLNDMENIYLYFLVASVYLFTNPSQFAANTCFKVFTLARCLHTVVYIGQVK